MIVPLDLATDASLVGGKAATLARLRAAGFPVPEGFVVLAAGADPAGLARAVEELDDGGGAGTLFAVRSSGYAEDSHAASFAGQYTSVLGVRGVEEIARAVQTCLASYANGRAAAYQSGLAVAGAGGAILVQRLVAADAAGVAFSIDPISGATDRVLVDAGIGLGEAVVGGHVTPDSYVVLKESGAIVSRRIGDKGVQAALRPGGIELVPVDAARRREPCLDDAAVRAVAELARRVEAHEGRSVDIEWAVRGGELYLLQARPVTAIPPAAGGARPPAGWMPELNTAIDPRFPLYSRGNVGEILPGCVTPLTYSIFSRGVERAFRQVAEGLGSMPDVGPAPVVVGYFFHRVYLNASYFMTAADNSPGASRDTVYEDLIGPPPSPHPAWTWGDLLPWRLWRGARIVVRFLAQQARLDADMAACRARYAAMRRRFDEAGPLTWRNADLADWIEVNDGDMQPVLVHIRASQFATSSFTSLKGLTRRWLDDATGALASSLVTGLGTVAGANPAFAFYDLAAQVSADPSLRELFTTEPDDRQLLDALQARPDAAAASLRDALARFTAAFGQRGFREAEFRSPTWREDPASAIAQIRHHLQPGSAAPAQVAERQRAVSSEARARALAALPAWKRGVFDAFLAGARKHIAAREEMKDLLLQFLDLSRRVIAAVKVRLADLLDQPDDVYFLLDGEVAAALRGALPRDRVAAIVRKRRQEFAWSSRLEVPKVQDGVARVVTEVERRGGIRPAASGAGDLHLTGVPVSAGTVEGRACVVTSPAEAVLQPGEILVAPVTDVAWTPLFLRAAGLVVEVGGPLSHGSIVAREYGIPAVTAVAGATQQIRTGDQLRVDGSAGVVIVTRTGRE